MWINALEHGNLYAFVAVLVSQFHNLQSLRLDDTFVWEYRFLGLMMSHTLLFASLNILSLISNLSFVEYSLNVSPPRVYIRQQIDSSLSTYFFLVILHSSLASTIFYLPSLISL